MLRVSLCLLTRNELQGCQHDVPLIQHDLFDEIYAVDGNSTDGTAEYLQSQGITVHRQVNRGLNGAYIEAARISTCDAVVVFFPKSSINPACLASFRPLLAEGFDLVVASRNVAGGRNEEDSRWIKPRKWGVMGLAVISSMLWRREGNIIWDVLHGVKAFRVDAFRRMCVSDAGVTIDLEMTVRSYRLRIPRAEFPIVERAIFHRESNFKIWPTGKELGKFILRELFRPAPEPAAPAPVAQNAIV